MKILYHHRIRSKDGQFVHVEEIVRQLRLLGHEVELVGPAAVVEESFGSESSLLTSLKKYAPAFVYELMEFCYSFAALIRLSRVAWRFQPDVIYERYNLFAPAGIWAKRIFSIPLICEVNAPLYNERKSYGGVSLDRLARWSECYVWSNADYVICVTEVLKGYITGAGISGRKVVVMANGVDIEKFSQAPAGKDRAKLELGLQGKTVLGFTGFMREWHRLDRVVELIYEDKTANSVFLAVGDGPVRESIERQAGELNVSDRVIVTGVIERDKMPDYIAAFDVALQPAVVEYASPLKLFEYMAMNCAIVAPATDNIREILTDRQDAILFTENDAGKFKQSIQVLLEQSDLRQAISAAARKKLIDGNMTWRHNAERVVELANELMARER
jgi:glycosyltransferase involved in cell wall biosynthesis